MDDLIVRSERTANAHALFELAVARLTMGDDPALQRQHLAQRGVVTPSQLSVFDRHVQRAAVGASDPDFGPTPWRAAWLGQVQAMTALDSLGIATAPANAYVALAETSDVTFTWVGHGQPVPFSTMTTARNTLTPYKVGGARGVTREVVLLDRSGLVMRDSQWQTAIASDRSAFDPTLATVAGVRPGSLTNAGIEIPTSGADGDAIATDVRNALLTVSHGNPARPAIAMNRRVFTFLGSLRLSTGQLAFPDLASRREVLGVRVVIGPGVSDVIVVLDAAAIVLMDGGVEIDISTEATAQLDTAPTMDALTGTGAQTVSFFQAGMVGIKSERFLNWAARADAVVWRSMNVGGSPL
jgi:hypothetical protein